MNIDTLLLFIASALFSFDECHARLYIVNTTLIGTVRVAQVPLHVLNPTPRVESLA
jgi:hypothetical protein